MQFMKVKNPFKWGICNAKLAIEDYLNRHVKAWNLLNANFVVSFFVQRDSLNAHIESDHEGKRPFTCTICKAGFTDNRNMKRHIKSVHEREKAYKCNICEASFVLKYLMKKHIKSVHEGKK